MPLTESRRNSLELLVSEWVGFGALDGLANAAGLGLSDPYAGTMMLPRTFKKPTDSPGLMMFDEKSAKAFIKKVLDKASTLEKGMPEFVSAAYQVVNFVSSQRLLPQKLRLHGKSKLTFRLNFPNAEGLERSFLVMLFRQGKNVGYDLKLLAISATPANAPTVLFKKT